MIIGLHLLINLLGVKLLAGLNSISAWWHMAGVAIIVAILIIVPDHHQSASYVFTKTINNSGSRATAGQARCSGSSSASAS